MTEFNSLTVKLEESNLIEASAGTGKTYSIAILALRMILEKNIPVDRILMVTFTKAATAELELRIRQFVRKAWYYAVNKGKCDDAIRMVVDQAPEDKIIKLKKAMQALDSLAVMTIHSFCQQMISNYPFETQQSFKTEIAVHEADLIEYYVNDHWRKHINTIENLQVFAHLNSKFSRETVCAVIKEIIGDKTYLPPWILTHDSNKTQLDIINKKIGCCNQALENYKSHVRDNWFDITTRNMNGNARNFIVDHNSPELFFAGFPAKVRNNTQYVNDYFSVERDLFLLSESAREDLDQITNDYIYAFYAPIVEEIKNNVVADKVDRNIITFDDLISALNGAVESKSINRVVIDKYKAVFIDEFQDTDRKQYEIFNNIFSGTTTPVFYIGDPKQSIYSWRKADLATYKEASRNVKHKHSMNQNFRSTAELIDALNALFGINDPFCDQAIDYKPVIKGQTDLGMMTEDDQPVKPVSINSFGSEDTISSFVTQEIHRLLCSDVRINKEPIQPSDIAILTRTNKQSEKVRASLVNDGIPAMVMSGASVLQSPECDIILRLLKSVIHPGRSAIISLLLHPIFNYDTESILDIKEEEHLECFMSLKKEWNDKGIYFMIFSFLERYNVKQHCLKLGIPGERSLSNIFQLAEMLQLQELSSQYQPEELCKWIEREKCVKSDEYEQRIESENEAVKIITIHKSKGLTFKVVFAPFLDLSEKDYQPYDFRDEDGYKITFTPDEAQRELYFEQQKQENRRLIYVALTRAQYKVYICKNTFHAYDDSALNDFLQVTHPQIETGVERSSPEESYRHSAHLNSFVSRQATIVDEKLKVSLQNHSFSALSSKHESAPFEKKELTDAYDNYIFQQLGRGAKVGTALHSIFEKLDFTQPHSWKQTLLDTAKYYANIFNLRSKENKDETITLEEIADSPLLQLVEMTMKATINIEGAQFCMNQIANENKITELPFYFSMDKVNKTRINSLLGEEAELKGDSDLQGLMMGFVDLLFEHEGKYYILDWKSNHLGNTPEAYNQDAMKAAMKNSNYDLQYIIYTLAVTRWLKSRLKEKFDYNKHFGGVIYLFLRGIRNEGDTGIYIARPSKETIQDLDTAFGDEPVQAKPETDCEEHLSAV